MAEKVAKANAAAAEQKANIKIVKQKQKTRKKNKAAKPASLQDELATTTAQQLTSEPHTNNSDTRMAAELVGINDDRAVRLDDHKHFTQYIKPVDGPSHRRAATPAKKKDRNKELSMAATPPLSPFTKQWAANIEADLMSRKLKHNDVIAPVFKK